jgi:hypothetical protein
MSTRAISILLHTVHGTPKVFLMMVVGGLFKDHLILRETAAQLQASHTDDLRAEGLPCNGHVWLCVLATIFEVLWGISCGNNGFPFFYSTVCNDLLSFQNLSEDALDVEQSSSHMSLPSNCSCILYTPCMLSQMSSNVEYRANMINTFFTCKCMYIPVCTVYSNQHVILSAGGC